MDLVSDALIRIKNGYLASKNEVVLPYSKLIGFICQLLQAEGYVESYKEVKRENSTNVSQFEVKLKYEDKKPAVSGVKRISKPGLRVYKGSNALPRVYNGLGIAIISTPKGVMSDKDARKTGVGGEVLAYIW